MARIDTLPGARAITGDWWDVLAVGDDGAVFNKQYFVCTGGRPFIVDGQSHTASLRRDDEHTPPNDTRAAAWAQDALHEHASVASFARFALELLALGAPPRLLRDLQAAIADELRHAQACFELARRFGGRALAPGPMPIAGDAFARVGDPIATALGLFEEACINESVAACAAAEAAARCEDAHVRRVLEGIADDERRHAVAGWAALRWMLDTFGDQVRQPLRARLGRLSARQPSALHERVLAQLVIPLARAMLVPVTSTRAEVLS